MDNKQLHEKLQELHSELQRVESVDRNERTVLTRLSEDIRELLDHHGEQPAHKYKNLADRLRESIDQFEASHPNVTMLMGQLADALAKMGI